MVSRYLFDIAYYWITKEICPRDEIDYDELKKKLEDNFHCLPEPLKNSSSNVSQDQTRIIKEALGELEYSTPFKFFLYNKGTWILSILHSLLILAGLVIFVIGQIKMRTPGEDNVGLIFVFLGIALCILARVFRKLSTRIFQALLKNMKPGDYIKIANSKDEMIFSEEKKNSFGNEITFNKINVLQSKKQLIAENIVSSRFKMPQNLSTYFIVFLAVNDLLKKITSPNAYETYLLEIKKQILEKIIEENDSNVAMCYELMSIYNYEGDFEKSYKILSNCRKRNPYDYLIEQFYQTLDFCIKHSTAGIRDAKLEDISSLVKLCNELGYETSEEKMEEQFKLITESGREHSKIWVAHMGGQIVAFVSFDAYELLYAPPALNVTGLVVTEKFRRQGIAKQLLEKVEKYGKENGFSLVRINSGKARIEAHEFYRKMDYDSEKEQIRFLKEI